MNVAEKASSETSHSIKKNYLSYKLHAPQQIFSIFYFEELSLWKSCQLLDNRVMIAALASLRDDFEDQVSLWKTGLFIRNHDHHLVWNYQLQAKYKEQSFGLLDSTNINKRTQIIESYVQGNSCVNI